MNLDEIARLSGVSRTTVSRVINNRPDVNDFTRQRVWQVIRSANYAPNAAAQSLAAGRTQVIGVVVFMGLSFLMAMDQYFALLIKGINSICNSLDYSLMLWIVEPEHEQRNIRRIMRGGLIDGLIVASMFVDNPIVRALVGGELPFVLVGRHPTDERASYVDVENVQGARQVVDHLLNLGRRRIALIAGPNTMIAGSDRSAGYLAGLRERGLTADPALAAEGDFTQAGGYTAMQKLLPHRPDAVFAANDNMALGALRAIREAGLRVPEDIALVGFDDVPFAAGTDPALTTIRQPIQRAGSVAAETLVALIGDRELPPRRIVLPTELVIRASSGYGQLPPTYLSRNEPHGP